MEIGLEVRALVEERLELGLASVAGPSGQGDAVRAALAAFAAILWGFEVGGEGGLGLGRQDDRRRGGGGGRR